MLTPAHRTAIALAVVFVLLLLAVVTGRPLMGVDRVVNTDAHQLARSSSVLVLLARGATFLGSTLWLTALVVVTALLLLVRRQRRQAVWFVLVAAGASLVESGLKVAVGRNRPTFADPILVAASKAFPSGHATSGSVVYGGLLLLVLPLLRNAALRVAATGAVVVLVAAIATSRVILGVHWLTDVVGGLCLGSAWLLALSPLLVYQSTEMPTFSRAPDSTVETPVEPRTEQPWP